MISSSQNPSSDKNSHICKECDNCLELLQIYLDNELEDSEKMKFVKHHLDHCDHCLECFKNEKDFRKLFKEEIKQFNAPEDLLNHIKKICSES